MENMQSQITRTETCNCALSNDAQTDGICVKLPGGRRNWGRAEKEESMTGLLRKLSRMVRALCQKHWFQRPQGCQYHAHGYGDQRAHPGQNYRIGNKFRAFNRSRPLPLRKQLRRRHVIRRIVERDLIPNAPRENRKGQHGDRNDHPLRTAPSCLLNIHKIV